MGELTSEPTAEELLARDEWPYELGPYEALGQRFRILTTDGPLARFLAELYAPMELRESARSTRRSDVTRKATVYKVTPPAVRRRGSVIQDAEVVGSSYEKWRVLGYLQWAINRRVIERASLERLVVHAGAVAREGQAVLLAGQMEAGKTTLTTGLLELGFGYLSDEAVAVGGDLTIEGYPKPLSLDPGSWHVFPHLEPRLDSALNGYLDRQWQVPPSQLAPVVATSKVMAVVITRFESGAPTEVRRLLPATAVAELMRCCFVPEGSKMAAAQVQELVNLATSVPVHRLVSGDLGEACQAVIAVLQDASSVPDRTADREFEERLP